MNKPNFQNVIETFIRTPIPESSPTGQIAIQALQQSWSPYIDLLRLRIAPLIQDLKLKGVIDWYSFLVHSRRNGVPTHSTDNGFYIHLRLEFTEYLEENELQTHLPSWCEMTQRMPIPQSMDTIDLSTLKDQEVERGYQILGETSELVLKMLEVHDQNSSVPAQNISQFLHYLGNQFLVQGAGIPMP